jgi:hypothetical protein
VVLADEVPAVLCEKSVFVGVQFERKVAAAILVGNQLAVEIGNEAFTRDSFALKLKFCGSTPGQLGQ